MRNYLVGCTLASALAIATVAAQEPPRTPPPAVPAAQDAARMVTVEGCLMREADIPGRKPNVAERAGIAEDYLLASTKMIKGSAPARAGTSQPKAGEAVGTSGTRGALAMYEVAGIDDIDLKKHLGRRVQIDGTFENIDRAQAAPESKTPADDLVELRGIAIRPVAGDCAPAK